MLPQVDALPRPEGELARSQWHRQMRRREHGAHVRRHVIRTLVHVGEERVSIGYQPREEGVEISAHIGVCILLNDQRGGGVVNEDVNESAVATWRVD